MRSVNCLFFLLMGSVASAQGEFTFPDSAAAWTNAYYYYPPPPPGPELTNLTSYCATGLDTLISDVAYKMIDSCGGGYKGAIRVLDEQVFFVPRDSLQEFLLYDFSLEFGDTAHAVYMEDAGGWPYVVDVRIFSDDVWPELPGRRIINTDEGVWIQGIGARTGLFMNSGANVSNYLIELYCMSRGDSTIYGASGCPVFLSVEDQRRSSQMSIRPNPTSGRSVLRTNIPSPSSVKVFSAYGNEVIVPVFVVEEEVTIDLSTPAAGVYFVQVADRDRQVAQRVVRE